MLQDLRVSEGGTGTVRLVRVRMVDTTQVVQSFGAFAFDRAHFNRKLTHCCNDAQLKAMYNT